MSLGNERPDFLSQVEKSLWKTLLRIAGGASLIEELSNFIVLNKAVSQAYDAPRRGVDWFIGGNFLIFSYIYNLH